MDMPVHPELLAAVNQHIANHPISATAFGRQVGGDPNLVFEMRQGRRPRPPLAEKIKVALKASSDESRSALE